MLISTQDLETEKTVLVVMQLTVQWSVGVNSPALSMLCDVRGGPGINMAFWELEEEAGKDPEIRQEVGGKEETDALCFSTPSTACRLVTNVIHGLAPIQ